jgi:hypothetical protein
MVGKRWNVKFIVNIILVLVVFSFPIQAFGGWTGPVELIKSPWEKGPNDFGVLQGRPDRDDSFPRFFEIDDDGYIYISDVVNDVIHKYNRYGKLVINIGPPSDYQKCWDINQVDDYHDNVYVHPDGHFLVQCLANYLFFGTSGKLINAVSIPDANGLITVRENGYYFKITSNINNRFEKKYKLYSVEGRYIGMFEGPQKRESIDISKRQSEFFIRYLDSKTYRITLKRGYQSYYRDKFKTFFLIERGEGDYYSRNYLVHRQTACDEKDTVIEMPKTRFNQNRPPKKNLTAYFNWTPTVIEEYGIPIVSSTGDIYCWARTKIKYKILKWTWQGEATAPQKLNATLYKNSIELSWEPPIENAGRITQYEISRSRNVCGPFVPLAQINKNVLRYEDKELKAGDLFYYQVRAIRGKDYSGFSNKVLGKLLK